jgi:hypothetical protein
VFPARGRGDDRFEQTIATWRMWSGARADDGPWQQIVARSLALNLLMHAQSGAVAAAATTSLPEEVGGQRNWDYRFCWIRNAACTLDALLRLGCAPEARAYYWWLLHASQLTRPRLQPLYQLGDAPAAERPMPLSGYRLSQQSGHVSTQEDLTKVAERARRDPGYARSCCCGWASPCGRSCSGWTSSLTASGSGSLPGGADRRDCAHHRASNPADRRRDRDHRRRARRPQAPIRSLLSRPCCGGIVIDLFSIRASSASPCATSALSRPR